MKINHSIMHKSKHKILNMIYNNIIINKYNKHKK